MIKVINVSKSYKNLCLFKDVNVKFNMGKKILISGINGSGKSVFLKLLVGYEKPDKGKIIIDEFQIGKNKDFIPNSGVSINAPEFIGNLTGMENLLYLANIRKIAKKGYIVSLAQKFDFVEDLNKKYNTYSLGMKQKLRIIQALMDKPRYLILDEPFDALDQESKENTMKLLNEFTNKDTILVFTSHEKENEKFADVIFEIQDLDLVKIK